MECQASLAATLELHKLGLSRGGSSLPYHFSTFVKSIPLSSAGLTESFHLEGLLRCWHMSAPELFYTCILCGGVGVFFMLVWLRFCMVGYL